MLTPRLSLASLVLFALPLAAAEPARLDQFGDPLPEGAVYRLGTTRFRPGTSYCEFTLSPNGKTFVTLEQGHVRLWDSFTGKVLWQLKVDRSLSHAQFSPDGKRLMAISTTNEFKILPNKIQMALLDSRSGKIVRKYAVPYGVDSKSWRFFPQGKYFLTREVILDNEGKMLKGYLAVIWDLETGAEVGVIPTSYRVAVSPDGCMVASELDGSILLWDVASKKTVAEFREEGGAYDLLTFSADSKMLATKRIEQITSQKKQSTSSYRRELVIWDIPSRKIMQSWPSWPHACAFSPDGKVIAEIDHSSRITVREVKTGKELPGLWQIDNLWIDFLTPKERPIDPRELKFGPDGTFWIQDSNCGCRCFEVSTGRRVASFPEDSNSVEFYLSNDGKTIATQEADYGPISIRDVATGHDRAALGQHRGSIGDLLLEKKEQLLLSRDTKGGLRVWDLSTGRAMTTPRSIQTTPIVQHGFGFLDDGQAIVAIGEDNLVRVWESRTAKLIRQFNLADVAIWLEGLSRSGIDPSNPRRPRHLISLATDKRTVAIAGYDCVAVWDVLTGRQLATFSGFSDDISKIELVSDGSAILIRTNDRIEIRPVYRKEAVAAKPDKIDLLIDDSDEDLISPDGQWFAHLTDNSLTMYRVGKRKATWTVPWNQKGPSWSGFTPDNRHLVSIGSHNELRCFEVATGKPSPLLEPTSMFIEHFNEGGFRYVGQNRRCSGYDPELKTAIVANFQKRQSPPQLQGDDDYAFSQDKRFLALLRGEDVIVVETQTNQQLASFRSAPTGTNLCCLFGHDSRTLMTGSINTAILVWDWPAAGNLKPDSRLLPTETTWEDLASNDPSQAYRAIFTLVRHPQEGVNCLRNHLKPATPAEQEQMRNWVADLDHPRFAVRARANRALAQLGEDALPILKFARSRPARSVEMDFAINQLTTRASGDMHGEVVIRQTRAIQALEWMNTPKAWQLLRELAAGEPTALRTKEAAKALTRSGTPRSAPTRMSLQP